MKVLFISRNKVLQDIGGDSIQMINTARELRQLGIEVDIFDGGPLPQAHYDLIHVFNMTRPADVAGILRHYRQVPYVVSTIYVDYSEFEHKARLGRFAWLARCLSANQAEYGKYLLRSFRHGFKEICWPYIFRGHFRSVKQLLKEARALLPNSRSEQHRVMRDYTIHTSMTVIPNGIDHHLFYPARVEEKDQKLVICVGRIEGRKNQLNVIRALNNTDFKVVFIGAAAENQQDYYQTCLSEAGPNISFVAHIPQEDLVSYYQKANVHILASWHETTGLVSLEAAACGCNIIVCKKGDVEDYFASDAYYCDPDNLQSITDAVKQAATTPVSKVLRKRISEQYTWTEAARQTAVVYMEVSGFAL